MYVALEVFRFLGNLKKPEMAFRLLHQVVKMVTLCCNEELVCFSFVTTTSLSGKMVTDPNFYVNLIMFSGQCLF